MLLLALGMSRLGARQRIGSKATHHRHPYKDQALALQWFDLTKQTVIAAAYPEP